MKQLPFLLFILLIGCQKQSIKVKVDLPLAPKVTNKTALILLGNLQDAGTPHISCNKKCCQQYSS
jgi:pyrroloquinoline quinone biosynthesis protein B